MELVNLGEFQNVGASKRATLRVRDIGDRSYHAIFLVLSGTTFVKGTHILRLDIKQAGKSLVENISGANLQDINDLYGIGDSVGYLPYYFGDPTALSVKGEHLGDLDTSIYAEEIDLIVDLASGISGDAVLEAYALIGPAKAEYGVFGEGEAALVRALRYNQAAPANAVTKKAYDLIASCMAAGGALRGLHLFHSALTEFSVKKNGIPIFEEVDDGLNDAVQTDFGRAPQAGLFSYLPIVDGNQGEALITKRTGGGLHNIQTMVTTSGGDTITGYEDFFAKVGDL